MSSRCIDCGNEIDEDAKFCTGCGTQISQRDSREIEHEDRRDYQRFLTVDASGGFLATVGPVLIWSGTVGVLTWAIIGLLSLRFEIGAIIDLPDLLLSMLIVVGIALSSAANYYLTRSYRRRNGQIWHAISYLPFIWGSLVCAGLLIMVLQVWTDFMLGPDSVRKSMLSLIGVGVCGSYAGYLGVVVVGHERIYRVARVVAILLLAFIAAEILDAIWLASRDLAGHELMSDFIEVGWTAAAVVVVYAAIAAVSASAKTKKARIRYLVTYLALGLVGFTIAVWTLWNELVAGAVRFIHGGILLAVITTIGLLLVQHYYKTKDTRILPEDNSEDIDQPESKEVGQATPSAS